MTKTPQRNSPLVKGQNNRNVETRVASAKILHAINNFVGSLLHSPCNVYRNIFPITGCTLRMFHNSVLKALIGNSGHARKPYLPTLCRCLLRSRGFQFRGRRKKYCLRFPYIYAILLRTRISKRYCVRLQYRLLQREIEKIRRHRKSIWKSTRQMNKCGKVSEVRIFAHGIFLHTL